MGRRPTLQVEDFPPEEKRRLKVNAAEEGISMREAVIAAVRGWCSEREAVRLYAQLREEQGNASR